MTKQQAFEDVGKDLVIQPDAVELLEQLGVLAD